MLHVKRAVSIFLFGFSMICHSSNAVEKMAVDKELANVINTDDIIFSVSEVLMSQYVFPEAAKKIDALLKKNLAEHKYAKIGSKKELAKMLTQDVKKINGDKHLGVIFDPEQVKEVREERESESDGVFYTESRLNNLKAINYGFNEVKILEGNIGYLDLRFFIEPEYASNTAIAAMNFLSNTKALIIDLRNNGGGSSEMIKLLSSYFFDSKPVHLNTFFWRSDESYTQSWTLPYVIGPRHPTKKLYILTSGKTFSAAEEFTYNLKHLKRATVIGEKTGGGAHPGGAEVATDEFLVWVPKGRSINPVTNTNWEGAGVTPHIKTTKEKALEVAMKMANKEAVQ